MPMKDFGRTLCVSLARTENRFTKKPKYLYSCNDPCGERKGKKTFLYSGKEKVVCGTCSLNLLHLQAKYIFSKVFLTEMRTKGENTTVFKINFIRQWHLYMYLFIDI